MCGPSGAQTSISSGQAKFFQELQNSYSQEFAGQTSILNSLNSALSPILAGGVNQMGFSAAEQGALTANAVNTVGANYRNAAQALNEQLGGRGGGAANLGSGVNAQLEAGLASQAAGTLSGLENQNVLANYGQGRQNFFQAQGALQGNAQIMNPAGFAGQATGAGNAAFTSATDIYNQGNAWQGALGGLAAGAVTGLSGGIGTGLGKRIGG